MLQFLVKRLGVLIATTICLTFVVFFLTNLDPNLEKLAKTQGNVRMTDEQVHSWLERHGYHQPLWVRYGEWIGILPGWTNVDNEGKAFGRCIKPTLSPAETPTYCGILQGDFGVSTVFKKPISEVIPEKLELTGWLMFWVLIVMVPTALVIGILAGMREGSKTDRGLSAFSILTTSTPEYVSGVILIVVFSSKVVGLKWFKGSSAAAMNNMTFENFALPVATMALFGLGYLARMTRASMAEVMTEQYIRTARLKGLSFSGVILGHALRNALIAPFTVIMLQFTWLLTGVVVVETLFNYKGFGWTVVAAAGNNDIELLMSCSIVAVVVVLITQMISDIGYVFLNPRVRVN